MNDETFKPFKGHTHVIITLAYSADGKCIATGSDDETIRIWEATTGRQVGKTLEGHSGCVYAISYSPDGQNLVSGSEDNSIRIWDTSTHETVIELLHGHAGAVGTVQYSPDGALIASGGKDHVLKLWDATSGVGVASIEHPKPVHSLAFSPNGKHLVTACDDHLIRIYDVDRHELVFEPISGHRAYILSVQYSPDGRRIASASQDHTICLWDARTGKLDYGPLRHKSHVNTVSFSGDGLHLVSCSQDTSVRIWDIAGKETTSTPLYGHEDEVLAVACSPDGEHFASCDHQSVHIWSMRTGQRVLPKLSADESRLYKPTKMRVYGAITSISWFPDGKHFALARQDNAVSIFNAQTGEESQDPLVWHARQVTDIDISRSGHLLASASWDTTVCVWDVKGGDFAVTPPLSHPWGVNVVCFTPDEARLATGCSGGDIYIWEVRSGASLHIIRGDSGGVNSLSISADGSQLVSGCADKFIRLWDLHSYAAVSKPLACEGKLLSVCFSPDGSQVLSGSKAFVADEYAVCLWDISRRELIFTFKHDITVCCVRFSSNGARFLSAFWVGKVNVWEVGSGRLLRSLQHGGLGPVTAAAFSPDGTRVLSGTSGGDLKLWDVETGTLVLPKDETASPDVSSERPLQRIESTDSIMNMSAVPRNRALYAEGRDDRRKKNNPRSYKSGQRAHHPKNAVSPSAQEGAESHQQDRSTTRRNSWLTWPVIVSPAKAKARNLAIDPQSARSQRQSRRQSSSASSSDSSDDEHSRQEPPTEEVEVVEAEVGCVASIFCCFGFCQSRHHNDQAGENIETN